ncbi:DNA-binding NarL/FixJ family response regulator [Arthrobacter sp. PvP102]|uniref:helix-turn-helix transcriptional regulator n=1 Tax=unclassified Arthrobacter TaxID=235627 RepID=UPI001AE16647|nr:MULTISPECIES: LuxR family transcriptional regulator [unclassified Arthrobacter]MBP1235694.1 DNA-binding NarL/FixJ family response regulator [Arthrobacter sp. PvP102]
MTRGAAWPLIGRREAVSDITRALAESTGGVLVTGSSGTGKTFLTTHALKQFRDDSLVVTLRCSAALSRSPYGALNMLLSDLEPGYLNHPVLVLSGLMRLLRERAKGKTVYLFVDNAGEADELTAVTIAQLARNRAVRLVLTCSDPLRLSAEISGLCDGGFLTRVNLEPLSFREAVSWLEEGLSAKVSHSAVQSLWAASDGNPHYLKMLAMELADSGSLVVRDGVWVLTADHHVHGRAITDLIATRLGRMGEADRRILEILSLAETLPLDTLLKLVEADDVDALEERGVLAVEDSLPRRVRIQSQLVADVVRENVPPGRSNELREMVLLAAAPSLRTPATELPFAVWALDCGAALSTEESLSAARLANRRLDAALALRFVRSVPGHEALAAAVTEEVAALMTLGDVDEALEVVRRHRKASTGDPALAEWIGLLLAESSVFLATPGAWHEATDSLARARKVLYDDAPGPAAGMPAPELRRIREQLTLAEAEAASYAGTYREMAADLAGALDNVEFHSAEFRLQAGSWLCEAWAVTGRQADAAELAEQLKLQCLRPEIPVATAQSVISRLRFAYLVAGKWDEAAEALPDDDWGPSSVVYRRFSATEIPEAICACMQGRGRDGLDLLVPGISQLRIQDSDGVLTLACAAAAYASALQGEREQALGYLTETESGSRRKSWKVSRAEGYFTALARAELDGPRTGIGELLRMAEEDRGTGNVGHELLCLSSAVRLGESAAAPRLLDSAAESQGPFAELCAQYARGIISGEADELMAAANLAARLHNDRFALDIAESVLDLDQARLERSLIRQAKHLAETCRRRLRTPQDGNHDRLTLTARELQIAQLAAAGASNKSIAAQLHVSVRTVEGHLYQIYGKLKIEERLELPVALGSTGDD